MKTVVRIFCVRLEMSQMRTGMEQVVLVSVVTGLSTLGGSSVILVEASFHDGTFSLRFWKWKLYTQKMIGKGESG